MSNGSLAQLLAGWLPAQRWFAGSGTIVDDIAITSDVQLATGDPELRHLLVDATTGGQQVTYQILVGLATRLGPDLDAAVIGTVPGGRVAYDAAIDPRLTAVLAEGITSERSAGPIRFRAQEGATFRPGTAGRTLPASASNTSIVFGDKAILKLLRRPSEGHHPDLEIPSRLARSGSRLVAAPLGWIEISDLGNTGTPAPNSDQPHGGATILAILSKYFPDSTDGWSLAVADLQSPAPDFTEQARRLGQATARLHGELADAFGTAAVPPAALEDLADAMATELRQATSVVPELAEHEPAVMECYARLAGLTGGFTIQRVHGDYHLAQVLAAQSGWVILDFEGEPSVPLARRRGFALPLRDVAGMLRSFDYVARHQLLLESDDRRLHAVAAEWVRRCQDAFCVGYVAAAGEDPRHSGPLLRALLLQKAVYEAVYEARHRPGWLPIPLHAIAEAVHEGER
jgi:maltokinase